MNNILEPLILIVSFVLLSFGENKANFCYFIKIAIFAIIVYILINLRDVDEHFESFCYPETIKAPVLMSYYSKSKGNCIEEGAKPMFKDSGEESLDGEQVVPASCPMPMDTRIPAEKSEKTKLKGFCRLPPDYDRY